LHCNPDEDIAAVMSMLEEINKQAMADLRTKIMRFVDDQFTASIETH
jgi:hypothetical protein